MPERADGVAKRARPAPLDSFDRKILRILQRNNLTPQREIAARVGLSPAAVHRRLRQLRANGVIARDVSIVPPERLGRPLTLVVVVTVESDRPEALAQLRRAFAAAPEVQHCYYVTGDADFVLLISVTDMMAYGQLAQHLFERQKNVRSFRTYVAMDRIKATSEVPV